MRGSLLLNYIFVVLQVFLFKPNLIYLGDSHVHYLFGDAIKKRKFLVKDRNQLVIWLGPVLMYTISKNGFRFDNQTKTILKLSGSKRRIIIVIGEIDCRVHFVKKPLS
jgi:hypothetical protein